jgi:S-DNA-T family DNA segregation ATPase FtsK/SpoIIIE
MSKIIQQFRRDILAILWLGGAVFLGLSLATYTPTDLSFNTIRAAGRVENACGYLGSFLSDILYQLFGLTAWVFVALFAKKALDNLIQKQNSRAPWRLAWGLALLLSLAALFSLHFPETRFFSERVHLGGALGHAISHGLVSVLNPLGVTVFLWSLTLALMVLFTERPLGTWFNWVALVPGWFQNLRERFMDSDAKPKRRERGTVEERVDNVVPLKQLKLPIEKLEAEEDAENQRDDEPEAPKKSLSEKIQFKLRSPMASLMEPKKRPARVLKTASKQVENWKLPELSILQEPDRKGSKVDEREIHRKAELLVDKLSQFDVKGEVVGIRPGPAVTLFEFKPNADVKISKIVELADDLSLALSSESVRIIAPIPGRDVVGIETSNSIRETVFLKDVLNEEKFWSEKFKLPMALGREANGEPKVVDLRKMPHLLVAGTTGSGKSVFVVSSIVGLLFRHSPKTLKLILIDPKQVDLAAFDKIPHLLMPPVREAKKAVSALKWAIREMDKRYRSMSQFGARGLEAFNETVEKLTTDQIEEHRRINGEMDQGRKPEQYYFQPLPYIVIVVEEFGDLMAVDRVNVEQAVVRLAQMARACGIHLMLAMQSPRKDVVTGLIKTNIPGRISFKVASKMDSRIILDDAGAERLLAQGDMLFLAPGVAKPQRNHGPWLTEAEIGELTQHWIAQGQPEYNTDAMKAIEGSGGGYAADLGDGVDDDGSGFEDGDEDLMDEKYDEILSWVSTVKEVSASLLQRRFRLGYPRAARMIEIFEREGVVGPAQGSKPRQVLISSYSENSKLTSA